MSAGRQRLLRAGGPLFAAMMVASLLTSGETRAQPASFPAEIIAPEPPSDCVKEYSALLREAVRREQLIKAAAERHVQPNEACRLIGDLSQAVVKVIKYLESHTAQCRTLAQSAGQLRSSYDRTAATQVKICKLAQQKYAPAGPTGDFWPASVALPPQALSKPANPRDMWMTPQSPFVR